MAENAIYTVKSNVEIAKDVYKMRLLGQPQEICKAGQFVNIRISGFYLRRPISVCDWDNGWIDIIYKILGRGTATMAKFAKGTELDLLTGLGNGFSPEEAKSKNAVLVGGGVGVPPLYGLAKALIKQGDDAPIVVLGFKSSEDVFYVKQFEQLGCKVFVATENGSFGEKGFVTAVLENLSYEAYFTCGPQAMLKAVWQIGQNKHAVGQLSFEERMGCGFGGCMGCTCKTLTGNKRVCVEGPVFSSSEVIF